MLILKRPWTRKPTEGVAGLNPQLPQRSFVHLLNSSLVASGDRTYNGAPVSGQLPTARGLECSGDDWYSIGDTTSWFAKALTSQTPMTMVLVCYPSLIGTNNAQFAVGSTLSATADYGFFFGYENRSAVSSPNKMRLFIARSGGLNQSVYFGPALQAGQRVVSVIRSSAAKLAGWVNGVGTEYSWTLSPVAADATRAMHVGRANFTSTVLPFGGLIESIAFIPDAMPDSWCNGASLSPYERLIQPRRIFVPVSGAGGGGTTYTLSTATYAPGSLTATGVTPRVTVTVA